MPTTPPNHSAFPEIRSLRHLIRQTHRAIRHGTIDYLAGARLIARLTESLSTLLQTEQHLNPHKSPQPIRPFNPFDDPNYQLPVGPSYDPGPYPKPDLYDRYDDFISPTPEP